MVAVLNAPAAPEVAVLYAPPTAEVAVEYAPAAPEVMSPKTEVTPLKTVVRWKGVERSKKR